MDQVRAMEEEMVLRIKQQGLDIKPNIVVVSLGLKTRQPNILVVRIM